MEKPIRLRDFIEDHDRWLYAVSTYDNCVRVGCLLRYIPDPEGERLRTTGERYRKLEFEEAIELVRRRKPEYDGPVQRVPLGEIARVLKPEEELEAVATRVPRLGRLLREFHLPPASIGVTGSLLCGLESENSDIDLVVYGDAYFTAREQLREAISRGRIQELDEPMWRKVYAKRRPAIPFGIFVLHERRKWNRGQFEGTYFDILYTRAYDRIREMPFGIGRVLGRRRIRAVVTDASLSVDSPAVYLVDDPEVKGVLSFTHTYAGQALEGETIEACGVCEEIGGERWLVVGTSRIAPQEYIVSLTLLEREGQESGST